MRLLVRNHLRVPVSAPISASVPASGTARVPETPWKTVVPPRPAKKPLGEQRREWIEALFSHHLPRGGARREQAIAALAADTEVWRTLHQARHSMTETAATIERLAASAVAETGNLHSA